MTEAGEQQFTKPIIFSGRKKYFHDLKLIVCYVTVKKTYINYKIL